MTTHEKKHQKRKETKESIFIESETEYYGQVIACKGDSRFEVKLVKSNINVIAKVKGSLTKGRRNIIKINDYVLLDTSIYEQNKYYIIHKYTNDEVKNLKKQGDLTGFKVLNPPTNTKSKSSSSYNELFGDIAEIEEEESEDKDLVKIEFDDDISIDSEDEHKFNEEFINNI
jgi:initiation factor 1A